jgi:signal transduction histidine kinase
MNVKDLTGHEYSLRIRPYRTEDNKIDGAVIVLVDLDNDRALGEDIAAGGYDNSPDTPAAPGQATRAFSAGLLAAQERERRHVAMELHDDVTQRLALVELSLASLGRNPPAGDELKHHLEILHEQLSELSDRMREIAHQLHPSMLEDLGPQVAIESHIAKLNEQQSLKITFHQENLPGNIDSETSLCIYRVVQEALHNVSKHSGAKSAHVSLKGSNDTIELCISDTGVGMNVDEAQNKNGLGLRSMQERVAQLNGKFEIKSQPGKGTKVIVILPQHAAVTQSAN